MFMHLLKGVVNKGANLQTMTEVAYISDNLMGVGQLRLGEVVLRPKGCF